MRLLRGDGDDIMNATLRLELMGFTAYTSPLNDISMLKEFGALGTLKVWGRTCLEVRVQWCRQETVTLAVTGDMLKVAAVVQAFEVFAVTLTEVAR